MKSFIFSFMLLFSLESYSYPEVGDKVRWTGSVNTQGGQTSVNITKEVVSYNKDTKKWIVRYEVIMGEEKITKLLEVDELYSPERYKEILSHCSSQGGTLEKITAPAGTYETCKISTTTADGILIEKWWGNIPFGVVGKNTRDITTKSNKLDLNSIVAGL